MEEPRIEKRLWVRGSLGAELKGTARRGGEEALGRPGGFADFKLISRGLAGVGAGSC